MKIKEPIKATQRKEEREREKNGKNERLSLYSVPSFLNAKSYLVLTAFSRRLFPSLLVSDGRASRRRRPTDDDDVSGDGGGGGELSLRVVGASPTIHSDTRRARVR